MVRVMYFYSWGDVANLQNREVRTREKRGTSVFVRWNLQTERNRDTFRSAVP